MPSLFRNTCQVYIGDIARYISPTVINFPNTMLPGQFFYIVETGNIDDPNVLRRRSNYHLTIVRKSKLSQMISNFWNQHLFKPVQIVAWIGLFETSNGYTWVDGSKTVSRHIAFLFCCYYILNAFSILIPTIINMSQILVAVMMKC